MNRDCKATLDDSVREEIERVLAPQDYSAAADSILEGIRESWMSDEDFTAMKEAFGNMTGLTREKLANDLAAGVAKGHSIDLQVMLAKTMIANLLNLGNNAASALLDRFEPAGPTVVVVPDIAKQTGSFTVKCDSPLGKSVAVVGSLTDELRAYCAAQGINVVDGKVERETC